MLRAPERPCNQKALVRETLPLIIKKTPEVCSDPSAMYLEILKSKEECLFYKYRVSPQKMKSFKM